MCNRIVVREECLTTYHHKSR